MGWKYNELADYIKNVEVSECCGLRPTIDLSLITNDDNTQEQYLSIECLSCNKRLEKQSKLAQCYDVVSDLKELVVLWNPKENN